MPRTRAKQEEPHKTVKEKTSRKKTAQKTRAPRVKKVAVETPKAPVMTLDTTPRSLGAIFVQRRVSLHIALDKASADTMIPKAFLYSLETNNASALPGELFFKKYVSVYARYLGLEKRDYERFYSKQAVMAAKETHTPTAIKRSQLWNAPRIVKYVSMFVCTILCLCYLGAMGTHALQPPLLMVDGPGDNLTSSQPRVTVSGTTMNEAQLTINGQPVTKSKGGTFNQEVLLTEGVNIITISAAKQFGGQSVVQRKVMYEPTQ